MGRTWFVPSRCELRQVDTEGDMMGRGGTGRLCTTGGVGSGAGRRGQGIVASESMRVFDCGGVVMGSEGGDGLGAYLLDGGLAGGMLQHRSSAGTTRRGVAHQSHPTGASVSIACLP
eukprot:2317988-Prymnesium_polylepis.2